MFFLKNGMRRDDASRCFFLSVRTCHRAFTLSRAGAIRFLFLSPVIRGFPHLSETEGCMAAAVSGMDADSAIRWRKTPGQSVCRSVSYVRKYTNKSQHCYKTKIRFHGFT